MQTEMETNVEMTTLNLDHVPKEIAVSNIFSRLSAKKRQEIRAVCKSWKDMVDTFFGQELHINNMNWEELQRSKNAHCARFTNWTRDLHPDALSMITGLRVLEIENPNVIVTFYNILPLLQACTSLKTLVIRNIVAGLVPGLLDINLIDWTDRSSSWLPNLETFKFVDRWPARIASIGNYAHGCCQQKTAFLSFIFGVMNFTKLSNIEIQLDNTFWWFPLGVLFNLETGKFQEEAKYKDMLCLPLDLIRKRLNFLTNVTLHYGQTIVQIKFYPSQENAPFREIQTFSKVYPSTRSECPIFDHRISSEYTALWLEILENQTKMQEFQFELKRNNEEEFNKVYAIVARNQATLEKISVQHDEDVTRANQAPATWNATFLQNFRNLKALSFQYLRHTRMCSCDENNQELNNNNNNLAAPLPRNVNLPLAFISNLDFLPPNNLTQLVLDCPISLGGLTLKHCFERLVNLQRLELVAGSAWFLTANDPIYKIRREEVNVLVEALPQLNRLTFQWLDCNRQLGLNYPSIDHDLLVNLLRGQSLDFLVVNNPRDYHYIVLNSNKYRRLLQDSSFRTILIKNMFPIEHRCHYT